MQERLTEIVADLQRRGVVGAEYSEYKRLSGGTTSVVAKLWAAGVEEDADKPVYVIKANVPELNREEAHFLQTYQEAGLFPVLKDLAPDHSYLVYHYLPGVMKVEPEQKAQVMIDLVERGLNRYQSVPVTAGWGWRDEPVDRWQSFLSGRVEEAKMVIGEQLTPDDHQLVSQLAAAEHRAPAGQSAYLLHGDCGVHNFLLTDGRLSGVIDATPVLGPVLYDLLYAFCSSPGELTEEVLQGAVARMTSYSEPVPGALCEEMLIALYRRINTCMRHHPDDLPQYLAAWQEWKMIYSRGK